MAERVDMATILDDEETVEAQGLSTSLDPYGQLVKMLMPRSLGIAIYDRTGTPLWLSDCCEGPDVPQLVEESLAAARCGQSAPNERDGFARPWDGETAYVFILRDTMQVLGALAVSCQDGQNGSRPFSLVQGLLRPALQVLGRELSSQYSIGDLRRDLTVRDGDLELLLDAGAAEESDADDLAQVLHTTAARLQAAVGALLVPDRHIALSHPPAANMRAAEHELLEKTQRNLFAWVQVQRRTLILNRTPPSSPLGTLPYKILAAPVRERTQHVVGLVVLFRPLSARDFELREARVLETVARQIGQVLQNTYDPATGLLTRAALEQKALALVAAARTTADHWVAYADVDRMHAVNDKHGMHVGDQVIESIGAAIRNALADNVMAARVAGDRFVLFFRDMRADVMQAFLAALLRKIQGLAFTHEGAQLELSASFGVAPVTASRLPLSHALAAAEAACKIAKQRGRGSIEVYQGQCTARTAVRRHNDAGILASLREAIANDRFRMEAQPIVEIGAGNTGAPPRRFELLLRMIDAAGESVAPDKFLLAAERNQLATAIDRWVVQYALEILSSAAPMLEGIGAHFTINISGQALAEDEFATFLEQKLNDYALPATLLSFEVSESAAVANIVRAEALIHRLRDMGHTIALDDFGRGLSSLTYLKSLSASHLKIDGALVRDLVDNTRAQTLVRAIVQFARSSQLKTTAESVESEAILQTVTQLGVDFGQGFALGRPRSLELVLQELLRAAPPTQLPSGAGRISRLRD